MHNSPVISAAILAGGEGKRMGFDKALITLADGRSNLELLAASLASHFEDVFVVRRPHLYTDSPLTPSLRVVYDGDGAPGPLTGVVSALSNAAGGAYVFIVACDAQPVSPAYLDLITGVAQGAQRPAILPQVGGFIQPFWGLYSLTLLDDAQNAVRDGIQSPYRFVKDRGIRILTEAELLAAGVPLSMFSNRNRP